jgi:hypothetical protein
MIRALLLGAVVVSGLGVGCSSKAKEADKEPAAAVPGPELPDPLTFDWRNLRFELGALGTVQATDGHAMVGTSGSLYLDPPALVDLDGDRHEEAVIPFVLANEGAVYGAFVFTMRDGKPLQIGAISTTSKPGFVIEGATIKTTEGVVWRWDKTTKTLVRSP